MEAIAVALVAAYLEEKKEMTALKAFKAKKTLTALPKGAPSLVRQYVTFYWTDVFHSFESF